MNTFARLAVGLTLCTSITAAQGKPNFSGTWEPIDGGPVQTVTHANDKLTIGHASEGGGHGFVYKTDGTENHSTLMNIKSVAVVTVNGDTLTIARVDNYPDGRVRENTQQWSLDAEGRLVIESKDGLKGETPATRKTTYKKRGILDH